MRRLSRLYCISIQNLGRSRHDCGITTVRREVTRFAHDVATDARAGRVEIRGPVSPFARARPRFPGGTRDEGAPGKARHLVAAQVGSRVFWSKWFSSQRGLLQLHLFTLGHLNRVQLNDQIKSGPGSVGRLVRSRAGSRELAVSMRSGRGGDGLRASHATVVRWGERAGPGDGSARACLRETRRRRESVAVRAMGGNPSSRGRETSPATVAQAHSGF